MTDAAIHANAAPYEPRFADYFTLLKPRVMSLVIFTASAGLIAAPTSVHPIVALAGLLCLAVGAGASGALNMWWDADIDAQMARTAGRPIPAGRMAPGQALAFGAALACGSVMVMGVLVNAVAAALLALTIGFYLFVYTMWLKRRTPQNIVIGGAAGAFPPMIGWAVATGGVSVESIALFAIIFLWTPPHFWALALYRCGDYARAGVPMLPVVAGLEETRRQIILYSWAFVAASMAPAALGFAGPVYLAVAALCGAVFIGFAHDLRLQRGARPGARKVDVGRAKRLFGFSILHLFALFAALIIEAGLRATAGS